MAGLDLPPAAGTASLLGGQGRVPTAAAPPPLRNSQCCDQGPVGRFARKKMERNKVLSNLP